MLWSKTQIAFFSAFPAVASDREGRKVANKLFTRIYDKNGVGERGEVILIK